MVLAWTTPGVENFNQRRESHSRLESKSVTNSLKICLISETLQAGVGRHIADAACAMASRGHEVHVLYSGLRSEARFLDMMRAQPGIHCHEIPMPRGICMADITAFRRIKAYVKSHGPFDVVHGESSKGGGYARMLKLFGAKTVVYSPHAFVTLSPVIPPVKKVLYHIIEVILAQMTSKIICTSDSEQEHARRLGIPQRKLSVVHNGSDPVKAPDRLAIRAALGITPGQVVIGFAGRMEDQKAPNRFIDAAMLLLPKFPHLHLLMIGDGPKKEYLETRMQKEGLADRATWLGTVDARQYMPAMDMFALSSQYEGCAYVLLEALHAGLPIVSTPVGGAFESIVPGLNGMIVPHDHPKEMAAAMQRLTIDTGLRQAMARASKERAAKFSIPRMVSAIEHLYLESAGLLAGASVNQAGHALATQPLEAANATR